MKGDFKDTRLIEAFDHIDPKYIAEVGESLKLRSVYLKDEEHKKPPLVFHIKQIVALVGCLILLSAAFPAINYAVKVISSFAASWGSLTTGYITDTNTILETDWITEKEEYIIPNDHIENAPYFIFSDDLEPISAEIIEKIKNAWYQIIYDDYYNKQYVILKDNPIYYDEENLKNTCSRLADSIATKYEKLLFSEDSVNHCRGRYYGTINGYIIFAFNTYLENEYNVLTVGNLTITNPTSFYIFAYCQGRIVQLEEAYKNKQLTDADITAIEKRHNEFNNNWINEEPNYNYLRFTPELEDISNEMIKRIRNTIYMQRYLESYTTAVSDYLSDYYKGQYNFREASENAARDAHYSGLYYSENFFNSQEEVLHYHYRYYGIINDCVILATYGSGEEFPISLNIAGYTFTFPSNYAFEVYYNNEIITVAQAYDSGLLNDADVQILFERHMLFEEFYNNYKQK